jgi:type II secretory pathway pseudopilin PulG
MREKMAGSEIPHSALAAFTMVEIAICLAVIGFALVAIIGVLPIGMSVQKENREDTVINFDANYLMDAIRSGSRGLDNLTNYIVVITNRSMLCHNDGTPYGKPTINIYTPSWYALAGSTNQSPALTNGALVMALLSLPKYLPATEGIEPYQPGDFWSNYVSADFRAITGSPMDQGVSQASKDFAFTYRVIIENIPSAAYPYYSPQLTTNNFSAPGLLTNAPVLNLAAWNAAKNLQANMHEIRLSFRWPVLPNGKLGNGSRVFRSSVSGQVTNFTTTNLVSLIPKDPFFKYYLLQPQGYSIAQ